jgi:helix-turn-helix protein
MGREDVWRIRDDRSLGLSWAAKLVWYTLESRGDDCRPSVALIAADCSISKATAKRAVRELVDRGCLKKAGSRTEAGDNDSNNYVAVYPAPPWVGSHRPHPPEETAVHDGVGSHRPQGGGVTQTPGVGSHSEGGGVSQTPKEEKGSVKEKCKKTSKDPSSEQSPDPGPDVRGTRPEVDRICDHLADRVEQLTGRRPPITITGWLRPARYLLDTDCLPETKIHQAIEFAARDEFWAPNIRSVSKLRDKLPQLRAAAARKGSGGANRHKQNTAATEEYLAAVDEYESRTQPQPERKAISS